MFSKGTFIGLGQFLKGQGGVAYFGLHEGKTFMTDLFASGPGGGVEDLNQIMDHDLYKNHPANNQSKFNVRMLAKPDKPKAWLGSGARTSGTTAAPIFLRR